MLSVTNESVSYPNQPVNKRNYRKMLGIDEEISISHKDFVEDVVSSAVETIKNQLPKIDDIKLLSATGKIPHDRYDTGPWCKYLNRPNPDDLLQKPKLIDIIKAMAIVSVAQCRRALHECVGENNIILPLKNPEYGSIVQSHSLPMPTRTGDRIVPLLMQVCLKKRESSSPAIYQRLNGRNYDSIATRIPQVVVATLYAMPAGVSSYYNVGRPDTSKHPGPGENNHALPMADEMDNYVKHMRRTFDAKNNTLSSYVTTQFMGCIPPVAVKQISVIESFLQNVAKITSADIKKWVRASTQEITDGETFIHRGLIIQQVEQWLSECCNGTTIYEWRFVAGQIVANLEELFYDLPFGKMYVDVVPVGPGSKQGAAICDFEDNLEKSTISKASWLKNVIFPCTYDKYYETLQELTKRSLGNLLLYKDANGTIRHIVNGRRFNQVDFEHVLCKVKLLMQKKSPNVQISIQPDCWSLNGHPFRYRTTRLGEDPRMKNLFKSTVDNSKITNKYGIQMPLPFLIRSELPNSTDFKDLPDAMKNRARNNKDTFDLYLDQEVLFWKKLRSLQKKKRRSGKDDEESSDHDENGDHSKVNDDKTEPTTEVPKCKRCLVQMLQQGLDMRCPHCNGIEVADDSGTISDEDSVGSEFADAQQSADAQHSSKQDSDGDHPMPPRRLFDENDKSDERNTSPMDIDNDANKTT